MHVSAGPVKAREGIRCPRTGVLGGYELPVVDAEIQTQFLWKSSVQALNHRGNSPAQI